MTTLVTLGHDENSLQRKLCSGESPRPNETAKSDKETRRPAASLPLPKEKDDLGPWQKLMKGFREHLEIAGHSSNTVRIYRREAARFVMWLTSRECTSPIAITPELCIAYQRAVYFHITPQGIPNPASSQVRMLTALRSLTRFFKRSGFALTDPGFAVTMPRLPKRLPRGILTEEDMTRLLTAPDVRTLRGYRDRTILEVLYGTGIRSGELVNLDVNDADTSAGRLHIRQGKGKKDRVVPLGDIAHEYVAGYLMRIRPRLVRKSGEVALFLGWEGTRLNRQSLTHDVRRHCRKAGVDAEIVLHTFRHTCATHMLKGGASIRHIQVLLGHESLATTEQYTRVEIGDLAEVHAKFHPRSRL